MRKLYGYISAADMPYYCENNESQDCECSISDIKMPRGPVFLTKSIKSCMLSILFLLHLSRNAY
jgi:hypothetical protein